MRKLTNENIIEILEDVCRKEKLAYEISALELISKESEGSARTALSILEQISIVDVNDENTRNLLNRSPKYVALNLAHTIIEKDRGEACRIIQSSHIEGRDLQNLFLETSYIFMDAFKYIALKTKKVDRDPDIENIGKTVSTMKIVEITEQLYNISYNIRQTVSEDLVAMTGILKIIDWYAKQSA
jgi:DNA polymerase III gamma/tau subunit